MTANQSGSERFDPFNVRTPIAKILKLACATSYSNFDEEAKKCIFITAAIATENRIIHERLWEEYGSNADSKWINIGLIINEMITATDVIPYSSTEEAEKASLEEYYLTGEGTSNFQTNLGALGVDCYHDKYFIASYIAALDILSHNRAIMAGATIIPEKRLNAPEFIEILNITRVVLQFSESISKWSVNRKVVLHIDDDPLMTRKIKRALEQSGNYIVVSENNSAGIEDLIRLHKPDVLLLDLVMPGKGGEQLKRDLSSKPAFADLKVIYLTSLYSREDTGPLGKSIGGDLFLSKQVNDKNLMECIDNLVAKK